MKVSTVITRETAGMERGRPIMIEVHAGHLVLRLKGTRKRYALSYEGIFWAAAKAEAEHMRRERRHA